MKELKLIDFANGLELEVCQILWRNGTDMASAICVLKNENAFLSVLLKKVLSIPTEQVV